jgi:hypothetical protein
MEQRLRAEWAAYARGQGQEIPLGNQSDQQQLQRQHQQQQRRHQQQQRQQQQIPLQNQSDQQNLQRQQQLQRQRQLQQHRLNPRPAQQNQAVKRNPLSSSYQQDRFHEDEYRPQNVAMDTNLDERDESFFENL